MNDFIFENPTRAYFGKGCVTRHLPGILKKYGSAVMLAYGGGAIKKNGVYDELLSVLREAGKEVVEFSGIMPNPTYAKVQEGAALAKARHVDLILGAGGGSVMDCCKAISLAAATDDDVWERFWAKAGTIDFSPLPLGVVVTVAGTGSEMNGGAVITNEKTRVKTGRDYPRCNPVFALLDPTFTMSVPALQTASGGFDTLSHIMETYFSEPDEDNVSDDISEALMRSVIRNLPRALRDPKDYNARSNLMWASTMGENRIIKLGKKMDFQAHQIEHQLGAYTDCNHGCGLAVISPTYYRRIYPFGLSKFVAFAKNVWQIAEDGKSPEELALAGLEALETFIGEIGLPRSLRELGVTEKKLLKDVAASCNIAPGSYKRMTQEEILSILEECF